MNVLCPWERLSSAPTRVKILSVTLIEARAAGIKDPIWAISTISATCLRIVDLPAMFGPVIISI